VSHSMSRAEREEFLAGLHVGVLSVDGGDATPPLTVPVWYTYQPGGVVSLSTGRDSRKTLAIAAAGRFALCAQDERPPPQGDLGPRTRRRGRSAAPRSRPGSGRRRRSGGRRSSGAPSRSSR